MKSNKYRKGIYVVIFDNIKNLVVIYRGIDEEKGYFKFPGGGIDEGETPEQAAIREAKEELGIDIFIEKFSTVVSRFDWPRTMQKEYGFRGQEKRFCLAYFDSEIPLEIEHNAAEVLWVKPREIWKYFNYPEQPERTKKVFEEFNIDYE